MSAKGGAAGGAKKNSGNSPPKETMEKKLIWAARKSQYLNAQYISYYLANLSRIQVLEGSAGGLFQPFLAPPAAPPFAEIATRLE